jgi:hypothetical protein
MVLIQKREWTMPSGERWVSWAVRWVEHDGRDHMKPFHDWAEAEAFFELKMVEVRARVLARCLEPVNEDHSMEAAIAGAPAFAEGAQWL